MGWTVKRLKWLPAALFRFDQVSSKEKFLKWSVVVFLENIFFPFTYFSFSKGPNRWWSVELFNSHIKLRFYGANFVPFLFSLILATRIHDCCSTITEELWPSCFFMVLSLSIPADEHLPTSLKYITVNECKIPGEIPAEKNKRQRSERCVIPHKERMRMPIPDISIQG